MPIPEILREEGREARLADEEAERREHGDAAVRELGLAVALELRGAHVVAEAGGIEEARRVEDARERLDVVERRRVVHRLERRRGLGGGRGLEGRGGAEGGSEEELGVHCCGLCVFVLLNVCVYQAT